MSKWREWIVVRRPNGLSQTVMNKGATFRAAPDREYIRVIEYAAYEKLLEVFRRAMNISSGCCDCIGCCGDEEFQAEVNSYTDRESE